MLSGQPGLFSAGLDVPALLREDRAGMRRLFAALWAAQEAIARSPVPVIGAITGKAAASAVSLAATAMVQADVTHERIAIESGAQIEGRLIRRR